MSFAAAVRRFSRQGARHAAAVYGGNVDDGTCDATGNNLQVVTTGKKFRTPFNVFQNEAQAVELGFSHRVQASMSLPRSLGIAVTVEIDGGSSGTEFTWLATGEVFRVISAKSDPATGTQKIGLRRLPATA